MENIPDLNKVYEPLLAQVAMTASFDSANMMVELRDLETDQLLHRFEWEDRKTKLEEAVVFHNQVQKAIRLRPYVLARIAA